MFCDTSNDRTREAIWHGIAEKLQARYPDVYIGFGFCTIRVISGTEISTNIHVLGFLGFVVK